MEEKQLSFIQRPKLSRNMQFSADADICMAKMYDILMHV